MALRIKVNHELENLEALLEHAPKFLGSGGRIGIVSFHSMEDRLVGEGEPSLFPKGAFSKLKRFGVAGSRPCQKSRGEEVASDVLNGDDWNGDESVLKIDLCRLC